MIRLGEYEPYALSQGEKRRFEKDALANYVLEYLIKHETTVFLDAGSTVAQIAKAIFEAESADGIPAGHKQMKLCMVTNNMLIQRDFEARVRQSHTAEGPSLPGDHSLSLVLTGGEYDRQHEALFGVVTVAALDAVKCHTTIIGTSGLCLDSESGLHSHALTPEWVTKSAIYKKNVEHRIVVCDHTKIGREDTLLCGNIRNALDLTMQCTFLVGSPRLADFLLDTKLPDLVADPPDDANTGESGSLCPSGITSEEAKTLRRLLSERELAWERSAPDLTTRSKLVAVLMEDASGRPGWEEWAKTVAESFGTYENMARQKFEKQQQAFMKFATDPNGKNLKTVDQDSTARLRLYRDEVRGTKPEAYLYG